MKLYPSIPHLPSSRAGGDRLVSLARARRFLEASRASDVVIVEEKLDGSCVLVACDGDDIVAFGREGGLAEKSLNEARRMFAAWVKQNEKRFATILEPGEAIAGEWMALVHGIPYDLPHEPFVVFDLMMKKHVRAPRRILRERAKRAGLAMPGLVHEGAAISIADARALLGRGSSGAREAPEGLVYRIENGDAVIDVAKWVRADKVDGARLPEKTGEPAILNWKPK